MSSNRDIIEASGTSHDLDSACENLNSTGEPAKLTPLRDAEGAGSSFGPETISVPNFEEFVRELLCDNTIPSRSELESFSHSALAEICRNLTSEEDILKAFIGVVDHTILTSAAALIDGKAVVRFKVDKSSERCIYQITCDNKVLYLTPSSKHCNCETFRNQLNSSQAWAPCKHIIAILLAQKFGKIQTILTSQEHLRDLCKQAF